MCSIRSDCLREQAQGITALGFFVRGSMKAGNPALGGRCHMHGGGVKGLAWLRGCECVRAALLSNAGKPALGGCIKNGGHRLWCLAMYLERRSLSSRRRKGR